MCECALPGPMAAVPAAQEPEPWEQQRFGLGLRLGSLGLSQGEGSEQTYGTAGIAARYRLTRRWELELALDHGTEQREDGSAGLRELNSSTLSALFHLRPQARWDLYLLAGVGSSERRFSDRERWDEAVPHVALGRGADLVVVAPATADLLARAASGRADDLLTNVLLTATCPVPVSYTHLTLPTNREV